MSGSLGSIRHRARIAAMQALFEADITDHDLDHVIEHRLAEEELPPDATTFFLPDGPWCVGQSRAA